MSVRIGVVVFPGTNCEHDVAAALERLGARAEIVWHGVDDLDGYDALVLPGGFAHGDYLRPGAIARFSPVVRALGPFAEAGGAVVGICNGFQVLTEAGLLPGALRANAGLRFICARVACEVVSTSSVLTRGLPTGAVLDLPINHYEGNYTCSAADLAALERDGRVVLRYLENPNGSMGSVAGISNAAGNVVGLMPHPERACDELLDSTDGCRLLQSLLDHATDWRVEASARAARPASAPDGPERGPGAPVAGGG